MSSLQAGDKAPAFSLPGTANDGAHPAEYQLKEALRDGPAILKFYMFDFHPACTEQLCTLDRFSWFDIDSDLTVFGISADSVFSSAEFANTAGIEFPLLSDSDGSVADAYGVLQEQFRGHKRIPHRAAFVVDTDRIIRHAWEADNPSAQPDWDELQQAAGM